jgi:hypothetical protein
LDPFQFSALPIVEYPIHRIAKDKLDNPVLLLLINKPDISLFTANLKLQNVSVLFDINCTVLQHNETIEKHFTVLSFTGKDSSLKHYFLKLCTVLIESIGNNPSYYDVKKEISKFVDLFCLAIEPPLNSVQGLWAELLIISESKNPHKLLSCWHSSPLEKFDFNNGDERIEVKSTTQSIRVHRFSIEQLHSPTDTKTIVASVFVKQSSSGKSITDLVLDIKERISDDIELIEKLEFQIALTLGKAIIDSVKLSFDYQYAKDSVLFYLAEDIPKISEVDIPVLVSDVRFTSDLSATSPVIIQDISTVGGLFESI